MSSQLCSLLYIQKNDCILHGLWSWQDIPGSEQPIIPPDLIDKNRFIDFMRRLRLRLQNFNFVIFMALASKCNHSGKNYGNHIVIYGRLLSYIEY